MIAANARLRAAAALSCRASCREVDCTPSLWRLTLAYVLPKSDFCSSCSLGSGFCAILIVAKTQSAAGGQTWGYSHEKPAPLLLPSVHVLQ